MAKELPSEEIQGWLRTIVEHFDREDKPARDRQIRIYRKLKYYWDGITNIYWSDTAHDWRVFPNISDQNSSDNAYYFKDINVFRAYLESIIAALSVSVPSIVCAPDDADNPLDQTTAKAGDKIADLIARHNDSVLLWIHSLFIYMTEGMLYGYTYSKADEKYGTVELPKEEPAEITEQIAFCPLCQEQMPDPIQQRMEQDEFDPYNEDLLMDAELPICDNCMQMVNPEMREEKSFVTRITGTTKHPKSRQCIEVYGGLYVKTALYAKKQEDTPYLIFAYETHYSNVLKRYPHLVGKNGSFKIPTQSGGNSFDAYERWGRLSTQYAGETPTNTVTVRNAWLRCSAFYTTGQEDKWKQLEKKYPNGVKVVLVDDVVAEICDESLDDHWTLSYNPLSDYLHHDPLGLLLTSVQDITTELVSLVLQTIEHGIPQTFADPNVLNFNQYGQTEVQPGSIFPAKPQVGKGIGDGFYEIKTATLSGEVLPFADKVQEMGQLTSGAMPQIFGGPASTGSKTAAQYSMQRAQALQRLQTPWKIITYWWKGIFGKVIPSFIKDMKDDERFVTRDEAGNFINVFIRKSELEGKIGSVELEASENLPSSWAQKKDVVMQLLQGSNQMVMEALSSPENLPLVASAIGLTDFAIPGEDDRQKQYEEIQQLNESEPLDEMTPSVQAEPMVDNNMVHADICRRWLVGEAGRLAKIENEAGYRNVLLHLQQHVMAMMPPPQMAPDDSSAESGSNDEAKPKKMPPVMEKVRGSNNATVN